MYRLLLRPLLFGLNPERAHRIALQGLSALTRWRAGRALVSALFGCRNSLLERRLWGIRFPNPVGLAAGFDKNGGHLEALATLGFGFIEIGTVTPRPQEGRPRPRLFRLPRDRALVNRMGFNNEGAAAVADHLRRCRAVCPHLVVGGNIGKNKDTPNEQAAADYEACFHALYPYVDYFVVNVSSPNTPGLRDLQQREPLTALLRRMRALSMASDAPKPILLKVSPDLEDAQLDDVAAIAKATRIDGLIAANTTVGRQGLASSQDAVRHAGEGGLSGQPLAARSTRVIRRLRQRMGKDFPIVGVGGIMSPQEALAKLEAGADLIQLYTGMIYEGPGLIKKINRAIVRRAQLAESTPRAAKTA